MAENKKPVNMHYENEEKLKSLHEEKKRREFINEIIVKEDLEDTDEIKRIREEASAEQRRDIDTGLRRNVAATVQEAARNGKDLEELIEKFYQNEEIRKMYEPNEIAQKMGQLRNAITSMYNKERDNQSRDGR